MAGRLTSVRHALAGIAVMLRTQRNASLHLAATLAVIAAGLVLRIAGAVMLRPMIFIPYLTR